MSQASLELNIKVAAALRESPYSRGQHLRFETSEGCVRLSGRVKSYFQKQMAQESLRAVDGIAMIENEIEVASYSA